MHRSRRFRGGEKRRDYDLIDQACAGGNPQLRKLTSEAERLLDSSFHCGSLVEENSLAPKFRRSSTTKTNELPMKMLIDEVSKEAKTRQSPSIVARLMGLDNFPPASGGVNKQQKNTGNHSHTVSSVGSLNYNIFSEDVPHRRSTDDLPEVKDVFEVMETAKAKKKPWKTKHRNIDMDFIGQAFTDAKRLSTDESHHSSKELDDALEVLESNKDLLLEFLQQPKSLFAKHLDDLNCSPPSPHASNITVLKPDKRNKSVCTQYSESEKGSERFSNISKIMNSCRKPPTQHLSLSGSFDENRSYLSCALPKHSNKGTTEANIHPTRIVILKPSFGKAHNMEDCGIQGLYTGGGVQPKFSYSSEGLGHRSKTSREIAREVTKQMRKALRRGAKKVAESELNPYIGDAVDPFETFHRSSNLYHDWTRAFGPSSPAHLTHSSANREARKRLSDRWKTTQLYQEVAPVTRGSSTLGDVLALSGGETQMAAQHRMFCQKASNDGWKDGKFSNLPRSRSLPSSPVVARGPESGNRQGSGRANEIFMLKGTLSSGNYKPVIRSPNCSHDRLRFCCSDEEESMLPEREIHVSSEITSSGAHVANLTGRRTIYPEQFDDALSGEDHPVDSSGIPEWQDFSPERKESTQESATAFQKNEELVSPIPDGLLIKDEPSEHTRPDLVESARPKMELESPLSSKEGERPSPVSVLHPALEDETSCSGCFERISADLQELRQQLRLLQMESSADADAEETELLTMSNDDGCDNETSPLQSGEISEAVRVEEERDFCYLLDMVIGLGVHVENWDELLGACYSLESPVNPVIFNKLEKKYSKLILWPRSERKLLFDFTNSVLSDIICSHTDLRPMSVSKRAKPGSDGESFVEEVWQMVASQREGKNNALELRWFGSESSDYIVGREMECMLYDDLLGELIADFAKYTGRCR